MFDDASTQTPAESSRWSDAWWKRESTLPDADDWAWPGRPAPAPTPPEPDTCSQQLARAVDALLEQEPARLDGPSALERVRVLLTQTIRLEAVLCEAIADVENRELFALDAAGTTSGWLRRHPAGDAGRSLRSKRFRVRTVVRAAVASGALGVAPADIVCRMLDALPSSSEPGQVEGVLQNAVPQLLAEWTADGGDDVAAARQQMLAELVAQGVAATALPPAERLEPAFAVIGQALSPSVLAEQLQLLVDALVPHRVETEEQQAYDERGLRLRQKRSGPGWRLVADLTDEVGTAMNAELQSRADARRQAQKRLDKARAAAARPTPVPETWDRELFGKAGPGVPQQREAAPDSWSLGGPRELTDEQLTDEQLAHDLLGELLADLSTAGLDQVARPRPATLNLTAGLDALEGRLGALPGTVLLPGGPAAVSRATLRRLGCDGLVNAVLLDAARTPVGASGNHRHATERERRALRAIWGSYCAVDGCGCTRTVPHHVDPWWRSGRTRLEDLVPICERDHWHVHNGHRVLLLRDGRLIDENGWVTPDRPPPDRPPDPYPAEPLL